MIDRHVRLARTFVLLLATAVAAGACSSGSTVTHTDSIRAAVSPASQPTLRWGGDAEGGAPFVEANPANPAEVRGFDVEIASMIAKRLGRRAEFVQVAWASIQQSVARGDFAMGMSGLEDKAALHSRFAVSIPYYEFREVLAVRTRDSAKFHTLADLRGKRVATLGSTTAWDMLLDARTTYRVVPVSYDDDVHPYTDLTAGRVDAVLLDNIIADRAFRRQGGFTVQAAPLALGHYVIVMAQGDSVLRDSVDATLRAAMGDGSLERLYRTWNVWDSAQGAFQARTVQRATAQSSAVPASAASPSAPTSTAGGTASQTSMMTYLPALLRAAVITLLLSVLAMTLAVALGVTIAAGRVYGNGVVRMLFTVYVEVIRGTPVLLQLFVLYYGLADVVRLPAFVAAVLGLGLNYAAYESEIYRAALESIPTIQLEAARTLGLSEFQILRLVRGPQALRLALAPMTNDFVALLKDSSLVSVITVVELTKQTAIYATNVGSWVVPGALCAAVYLAMSLPLSRVARRLEQQWRLP